MIILVMGLPGSGKTTLALQLSEELQGSLYLNADKVRTQSKDWDFTMEGRIRQARRMKAKASKGLTICDFVCPTDTTREALQADFIIFLDTISCSRYEDTNLVFQKPTTADIVIKDWGYNTAYILSFITKELKIATK